MTLEQALEAVAAGARVTCDVLQQGAVVKLEPKGWAMTGPRVVFEATGSGYDFTPRAEHETADWRKVEGWA